MAYFCDFLVLIEMSFECSLDEFHEKGSTIRGEKAKKEPNGLLE